MNISCSKKNDESYYSDRVDLQINNKTWTGEIRIGHYTKNHDSLYILIDHNRYSIRQERLHFKNIPKKIGSYLIKKWIPPVDSLITGWLSTSEGGDAGCDDYHVDESLPNNVIEVLQLNADTTKISIRFLVKLNIELPKCRTNKCTGYLTD